MAKRRDRERDYSPILVTEWLDAKVKAGVFHISFKSGDERIELAMGPNLVLAGIELAQRTMSGGDVLPFEKKAPAR